MTGPVLRVARVHFPVTALGPGRRLGIWVQGCGLACPGCMSRETWDPSGGTAISVSELAATWRRAAAAGADGITVSGGEPLDQELALAALLGQARQQAAGRAVDILVFTGYELEQARRRAPAVLAEADAIITGRFEVAQPTALLWRGSANQRLVPLTELGHTRYQEYVTAWTAQPPVQVGVDSGGCWLIGVPRRGDLGRLEKTLRDRGITVTGPSWRPSQRLDAAQRGAGHGEDGET